MTKHKKLKHSEYYDLQDCFDKLYAKSKQGDVFTNLVEIISSEENIRLAYRNIKRNSGSLTSGVDKLSIKDIEKLSAEKLVGNKVIDVTIPFSRVIKNSKRRYAFCKTASESFTSNEQLDIFSRRELEQELDDLYEEWDEIKYQRDAVDTKSLLETVYMQTQDMINIAPANISTDQWNAAILSAFENVGNGFVSGVEREMPSTSAVYNIVVNAQDKTTDQIVKEVQRAISSGVI